MFKLLCTFEELTSTDTKEKKKGEGKYTITNFLCSYKNREWVKKISFTSFNEKVAEAVKDLKPGDIVDVSFDITANQWKGRWYDNVNCFFIAKNESVGAAKSVPSRVEATRTQETPEDNPEDDLPF